MRSCILDYLMRSPCDQMQEFLQYTISGAHFATRCSSCTLYDQPCSTGCANVPKRPNAMIPPLHNLIRWVMTGTLCRLLAHFQDGSEARLLAMIQPNVAQFQVHNFRCTFGCSISRCKRRIDRAKACNAEPHLAWCNYSIPLPPLHCTLIQKSRPVNPLWEAKYRGNPYKLLGEPNWKN